MSQPWPVLNGSPEPTQENHILNFADIFREYERPIYRYLLRLTQNQIEAEDLTQETFIRVERSLATFRGEASLSTWLYRIATNANFDHFRRQSTRQARNTLPLEETVPLGDWAIEPSPSPDQQVNQAEMSPSGRL